MSIDSVNNFFKKPEKYFQFFGFSIFGDERCPQKMHEKIKHGLKVFGFWFYVIGLSFVIITNIIHDMIYHEEQNHQKIVYFVNIPFSILKIFMIRTYRNVISEMIEDFRDIYKNSLINEEQFKGLKKYIKMFLKTDLVNKFKIKILNKYYKELKERKKDIL